MLLNTNTLIDNPSPWQIAEELSKSTCDVAMLDSHDPQYGYLQAGLCDDIDSVPHFQVEHITETTYKQATKPLPLETLIRTFQAFSAYQRDWHAGFEWEVIHTKDQTVKSTEFDRDLGNSFDFGPEELNANRNHTLSPAQQEVIDTFQHNVNSPIPVKFLLGVGWCVWFIGFFIGLFGPSAGKNPSEKILHSAWETTGITVAFLIIFVGGSLLGKLKFRQDEPITVRHVEGKVVIKRTFSQNMTPSYVFKVQGKRFGSFRKEKVDLFDPLAYYRVYYIEYGTRILLSIERL